MYYWEGFRESLKPLISQFEKPEGFKEGETEEERKKNKRTENLYTQNLAIFKRQDAQIQKLEENQEVLLKKLKQNRRAMTDGLEKIDEVKRWDLAQLPGPDLGTPGNIPQIGDLKSGCL